MEVQAACAVCGSRSTYKCRGCENVYYCSKQHQKNDWNQHAKICKAFKLAENSILGRHYIATRNIKVGQIVFKDKQPLVAGPMQNCVPACLGCYAVLHKDTARPCIKCGWPLCENCTMHGLECDFTRSRKGCKVSISEFGHPHPSYMCITVIRALALRDTSPQSYKKLLSLESHYKQMQERANFTFGDPAVISDFIRRFFSVEDIPNEEITKLVCILQVNAHEVPLAETPYVAVYELASILEHNCRANCSKSFTDIGELIIHAATPIRKGEHISICYTEPFWGTANRRHHLLETKFFECNCDRCKDTTEFGTMFSALKCLQVNCPGYILPTSFLVREPEGYLCQTCGSIVTNGIIEDMLEKIGIYLSSMKKNDIKACKEFLHRYAHVLHENHFYMTDVKIVLCQLIGQQDGNLTTINENLLTEKIDLCGKLDNLFKLLAPAENRVRGMILFELHAALTELSRRHAEKGGTLFLQESNMCLIDSCKLLKYEPKILPEGKIFNYAKKNMYELNKFLHASNKTTPST